MSSTPTKLGSLVGAQPEVRTKRASLTRFRSILSSTFVTLLAISLLAIFLAPFLFMVFTSMKNMEQISTVGSPIWPAEFPRVEYQGKSLEIFKVPLPDGTTQELALLKKGQKESVFIDPKNPEAGEIVWQGSWRSLDRPWKFTFKSAVSNYTEVIRTINFPRLLWNTTFYAIMTEIGTLISCVLVAFGFARFRFPGREFLFILLISTLFLPGAVTIIPTYTFFQKIGWVGTWLPLIVPAFFANAYDVFLLRQYFLTLPRELDEAAMIDGASPLRVLWSVIIPQSYPVLMAVTVFHIVWAWNDYFGPLIYLSTKPELQPISVALSRFNGIYGSRPQLIQAGALMALIAPLILFALAQRFFVQGIVITGVEK